MCMLVASSPLTVCSHRKKRMKQIQKKMKVKGDDAEEDPFELFVSSTNIRYCYYKVRLARQFCESQSDVIRQESHKILGNTYGMCVLQVRQPSLARHVSCITRQCRTLRR